MARPNTGPWTRQVRRRIQTVAHVFGLHVGRYPPVDALAYHLKTILRMLGIDVVLDVGAHEGEFAGHLRENAYAGRIVSFEPVRSSFERLAEARRGDPGWRGENVALGDVDGERAINIYRGSVFNSFLRTTENGLARFGDAMQLVRTERVRVPGWNRSSTRSSARSRAHGSSSRWIPRATISRCCVVRAGASPRSGRCRPS